ncbi:hypothetical protein R3P38DRAFT_3184589 [Favolaschia claudopus]|uniref:Uncharacterized protein n=1 Tax=Favolaschia claudopus TaxID=2862362 RepID=A0AAW0C9X5_9AGAR
MASMYADDYDDEYGEPNWRMHSSMSQNSRVNGGNCRPMVSAMADGVDDAEVGLMASLCDETARDELRMCAAGGDSRTTAPVGTNENILLTCILLHVLSTEQNPALPHSLSHAHHQLAT